MVSQIDFMDLIDTLGCGELRKQMTRIVGGVPADTGEWPWMAALLRDKTD
jgi:secreted trypsin-like serine protease